MISPLTTAAADGLERDEYRTPPEIFDGLNCRFDLDVSAPTEGPCFVPATASLTVRDDGLTCQWASSGVSSFVWMNPPFGKRNGQVAWLRKFFAHGHGIGLVNALTSSGWFHDWMPLASALFLPRGKTKFVRPDGTVAKQPANGIVLFSAGNDGRNVLCNCSLPGMFLSTHIG